MAQWTTTYSGLTSALRDYVEDNSTEYSSAVAGCINRAEERILRDLDLSIFNTVVSTSTSAGVASISKGFSESPVQSIYCASAYGFLEPRPRSYIQEMSLGSQGVPSYFYEDQSSIYFAPTPDNVYSLSISYMLRPTPLSGSNPTNWVSLNAADALLWAALVESEAFLIAPERVQEFEANYAKQIGPLRGFWRTSQQNLYEPIAPTPTPAQTR